MCIWDSYVYQKGVLCFLIHKSYVRSIKRYCFVRKYAAIPAQLEIFILQYNGWYGLVNLLLLLLLLLLTAIELSLSGSNPYIGTDKTNNNKYT